METKIIAGAKLHKNHNSNSGCVCTHLIHVSGCASISSTTVPTIVQYQYHRLTNVAGGSLPKDAAASNRVPLHNASITTAGLLSVSLASRLNTTPSTTACCMHCLEQHRPRTRQRPSWYSLQPSRHPEAVQLHRDVDTAPDGTENMASLQCYTASGSPATLGAGQNYQGLLLVNYTHSATIVNASTSWTSAGAVA